jgi:hypothetical protein
LGDEGVNEKSSSLQVLNVSTSMQKEERRIDVGKKSPLALYQGQGGEASLFLNRVDRCHTDQRRRIDMKSDQRMHSLISDAVNQLSIADRNIANGPVSRFCRHSFLDRIKQPLGGDSL